MNQVSGLDLLRSRDKLSKFKQLLQGMRGLWEDIHRDQKERRFSARREHYMFAVALQELIWRRKKRVHRDEKTFRLLWIDLRSRLIFHGACAIVHCHELGAPSFAV